MYNTNSPSKASWKPHNAAFVTRRTTDSTCSTANTMKLSLQILRRSLAKSVRKLSPPQNWPWSISTPRTVSPCLTFFLHWILYDPSVQQGQTERGDFKGLLCDTSLKSENAPSIHRTGGDIWSCAPVVWHARSWSSAPTKLNSCVRTLQHCRQPQPKPRQSAGGAPRASPPDILQAVLPTQRCVNRPLQAPRVRQSPTVCPLKESMLGQLTWWYPLELWS